MEFHSPILCKYSNDLERGYGKLIGCYVNSKFSKKIKIVFDESPFTSTKITLMSLTLSSTDLILYLKEIGFIDHCKLSCGKCGVSE